MGTLQIFSFIQTKKPLPESVTTFFHIDQRRPTLTGGDPQLPSAQKSLTAVFGMGTGVASLPSSLDYLVLKDKIHYTMLSGFFKLFFKNFFLVRSKLDKRHRNMQGFRTQNLVKSSID